VKKRQNHRELIEGWHPFTEEECWRYSTKGLWENLTVCELLDRNADRFPDKTAVIDEDTEVTWRQLRQRSDRLAVHLKRLGVQYGDFFVLLLMNAVQFPYFFFALNRLGAVPVMCLPRHRRAEIEHETRLHQAKGIVVPVGEKFEYVGMVDEIRDKVPHTRIFLTVGGEAPKGWTSVEELMEQQIAPGQSQDYLQKCGPVPDDICTEQLSGGTTGIPKGIPRTHNDYIFQWRLNCSSSGWTDECVGLIIIPAAHNASIVSIMGPATYAGGTIVYCKTPRAEKQFELIEKYKVTHVMMIPIQIANWRQALEKKNDYDLRSLRIILSGAEKVPPQAARWVLDHLGVNFINAFGMAEGPTIQTRWTSPRESQMHTIGRPMMIHPEVRLKLVDPENREVEPGEIGELVMQGPLTFKGYFRNDAENKVAFDAEGFFHSGDLMSCREDGRYVIEGRKKDMIKRAGESIYPAIVESKIEAFEKVVRCVAVGIPDRILGEKLCVFVQPVRGESLSLEHVVGYLNGQGASIFELPERLEVVEGWPLTPKNAIDKRLLRAFITVKAVQEGAITKEHGDEYLRRDRLTVDDVIGGKVKIEFIQEPHS
jgi:2,3-dihydroxybenzoate-AMP ligase